MFGWQRDPSVPGSPIVLVACLTTRILLAASIRSMFDISLVTAATISDVSPLLSRLIMSSLVVSASSHSRSSPTCMPLISA